MELDHKHRVLGDNPRAVQTSVVKKSAATRAGQCARRNVRQGIGRSPLGGMPSGLENPRTLRWGHAIADVLQRTLDARVVPARIVVRHPNRKAADLACTPGRPNHDVPYVHFPAINPRCH